MNGISKPSYSLCFDKEDTSMGIRTYSYRTRVALSVGMMVVIVPWPTLAGEGIKACELLTLSELESVIGAKVIMKSDGTMPGGKTEHCTGQGPTSAVLLRLVSGLDSGRERSGSKEKAGLEMVRKMGAQVGVKTFGPIVAPPSSRLPAKNNCDTTRPVVSVKRQRSLPSK